MSLLAQIALGVLVAGGIGWGVWNSSHRQDMEEKNRTQADVSADVKLTTGSSNADLDNDLKSIDNQLKLVGESEVEADGAMK